jgi:hypothetical protein
MPKWRRHVLTQSSSICQNSPSHNGFSPNRKSLQNHPEIKRHDELVDRRLLNWLVFIILYDAFQKYSQSGNYPDVFFQGLRGPYSSTTLFRWADTYNKKEKPFITFGCIQHNFIRALNHMWFGTFRLNGSFQFTNHDAKHLVLEWVLHMTDVGYTVNCCRF